MRALGLEDTGKRKALQVSLGDFLTTFIIDHWANKGGIASIRGRNVQGKTLEACMAWCMRRRDGVVGSGALHLTRQQLPWLSQGLGNGWWCSNPMALHLPLSILPLATTNYYTEKGDLESSTLFRNATLPQWIRNSVLWLVK
jgi:hypothetical protein